MNRNMKIATWLLLAILVIAAPASGAEPMLPLEAYAGRYDSRLYGPLEILLEEGSLVLRRPDSEAEPVHQRWDTFTARWRSLGMPSVLGDALIYFTTGPADAVTSVDIAGFALFERVGASPASADS